jgi:hypothetical protein
VQLNGQRFDRLVHAGFFVVLATCAVRQLIWKGGAFAVICGALALGLIYAAGWTQLDKRVWAAVLLAGWVALTAIAPSFVWLGAVVFLVVLQRFPFMIGLPMVLAGAIFAAVEGTLHPWNAAPAIAALALTALAIVLAAQQVRWIREHPPQDRSLPASLRRMCEDIEGVTVRFRLVGEPVPVPTDTESALLRVAQGALANVREHSEASSAIVTLEYADGELTLDVSDNGVGFDAASGHGMVLRASSQRMEALGGKVTIESIPGRGTVLVVSVPAQERD